MQSIVESRMTLPDFLKAGVVHGEKQITAALGGQYESPKGIYYGGTEIQPEPIAVEQMIEKYAAPFTNLAFVDMHTGLSQAWLGILTTNTGVNQVMTNALPANPRVVAALGHEWRAPDVQGGRALLGPINGDQ